MMRAGGNKGVIPLEAKWLPEGRGNRGVTPNKNEKWRGK